tara:strand:+ start:49 stop:222 length:174 start_codon:yes stop_codon:yes gene_type:complete
MKIRYREQKRFLRKSILVLQVGVEVDETWNDTTPLKGVQLYWRDATTTDLALKEQVK